MRITDVTIYLVNEDKLKAFVTITLDDCFVVRDIKIIQGHHGLFVAMPSRKRKDGKFQDIAHPLTPAMRNSMEKVILDRYEIAQQKKHAVKPDYPE